MNKEEVTRSFGYAMEDIATDAYNLWNDENFARTKSDFSRGNNNGKYYAYGMVLGIDFFELQRIWDMQHDLAKLQQ